VRAGQLALGVLGALLLLVAPAARADDRPSGYDARAAHAQTDRNGDGQVDLEEFHVRLVDVFFLGDADKDGVITAPELNAVVVFPVALAEVDDNGDGKIQLYEFLHMRYEQFKEADENGDGLLSVEEVVEAAKP
jgi:hypothetical protein